MFSEYNDILCVSDICDILLIGKNRVYELLGSGELKGFRVGIRVWKIPKTAVNDYIYQQLNPSK